MTVAHCQSRCQRISCHDDKQLQVEQFDNRDITATAASGSASGTHRQLEHTGTAVPKLLLKELEDSPAYCGSTASSLSGLDAKETTPGVPRPVPWSPASCRQSLPSFKLPALIGAAEPASEFNTSGTSGRMLSTGPAGTGSLRELTPSRLCSRSESHFGKHETETIKLAI